jgi:type II secretory pathway pseudopilin PulG
MPLNPISSRCQRSSARARDLGESLVETVLTIMIVSITVTALVSALGSAANASNVQRTAVRADAVMRNYAEATKAAVQTCTVGGTYTVSYTPPTGYSVATSPTSTTCPAVTTTQLLTLSVTGPTSAVSTMQIRVRTP